MDIKDPAIQAAADYADKLDDCWSNDYYGFIEGVEWERSQLKWISVNDRWPKPDQRVLFVVYKPGGSRHGQVYGGTFTGFRSKDRIENEFSTPGHSVMASHWMPSPEAPKPTI